MKATLDFDLNDPDDRMDHKRCVNALNMALVLWHFHQNSKKSLHYKVEAKIENNKEFTPYDAIDLVFERFQELLDEHDINIDNLLE